MLTMLVAGLWAILWKYMVAIGVGGCLLILTFIKIPFVELPRWVRVVAGLIGAAIILCTVSYSVGLRDEHRRGVAQWTIMVDKEIEDAKRARVEAEHEVVANPIPVDPPGRVRPYDRHDRASRSGR